MVVLLGMTSLIAVTAAPRPAKPTEAAPAQQNTAGLGAVAPSVALVETTIAVPDALRIGAFAQPRTLDVQPGLSVSLFALVDRPRALTWAPWGEWLVSRPGAGEILGVRDTDGNGVADTTRVVLAGLRCPYGTVVRGDDLYVAQSTTIGRYAHMNGDGRPVSLGTPVTNLPDSGCGAHHFRPLAIDTDGNFFVAFGSSCNVCVEADARRGTIWRYTPDGEGSEFAQGLRNVVDLSFDPVTGQLWAATNERDNLGDDIPPEPVTPVEAGANYGWPYCYWTPNGWRVDTRVPNRNPNCQGLTRYHGEQAHSAPLGVAFLSGTAFPETIRRSAFSAFHGSWNRSVQTGFKVIRIALDANGAPSGTEDFVTGWNRGTRGPGDAWGRPVDLQEGPDGALYVTDDVAGAIYRISAN
jgi:glucose/arabinose dehydrogenase